RPRSSPPDSAPRRAWHGSSQLSFVVAFGRRAQSSLGPIGEMGSLAGKVSSSASSSASSSCSRSSSDGFLGSGIYPPPSGLRRGPAMRRFEQKGDGRGGGQRRQRAGERGDVE